MQFVRVQRAAVARNDSSTTAHLIEPISWASLGQKTTRFCALQCVSVRECERGSLNEVGEIAEFVPKLESCVLDFESCAFNRTLPPLQRVFGCFQIGFANLGQFWANSGTVNASETGQTTSPINW